MRVFEEGNYQSPAPCTMRVIGIAPPLSSANVFFEPWIGQKSLLPKPIVGMYVRLVVRICLDYQWTLSIQFFSNTANSITSSASRFDSTTWAMLAVITVVFGYFMLRGHMIR